MHLFAYAVIRSLFTESTREGVRALLFRSFPLFLSLAIFEFRIRLFFFFIFLCFKMQAMPKNVCGISVHPTQYRIHQHILFIWRIVVVCCDSKRAHRCHGKSNAEQKNTHSYIQTQTEATQMLDLPTRFHLSHLILFFSVSFPPVRGCVVCALFFNRTSSLCSVVHALTFFLTSFLLILVIVRFYIPF